MEVFKIQNHNIFDVAGGDRRMLEEENHNALKTAQICRTYQYFRGDCFGSMYFAGCMQSLMVDQETQGRAARYIR